MDSRLLIDVKQDTDENKEPMSRAGVGALHALKESGEKLRKIIKNKKDIAV